MLSQTPGDCFTCAVSELTGIDYDLLPVAPPIFICNRDMTGGQYGSDEDEAKYREDFPEITGLTATLSHWQQLLNLNGFQVTEWSHKPPTAPYIAVVRYGNHVVVVDKDGRMTDNKPDEPFDHMVHDLYAMTTVAYLTIKPINN